MDEQLCWDWCSRCCPCSVLCAGSALLDVSRCCLGLFYFVTSLAKPKTCKSSRCADNSRPSA